MHNTIAERVASAQSALGQFKTSQTVKLIAVSKTKPSSDIEQAYAAGQRHFGENYVQELVAKAEALNHLTDIVWHFIGPIQSNKTRDIARFARVVHSVDRLKIAERLSAQRPADLPPLQVLVQVNISDEDSKSGVPPSDALALADAIAQLPNLQLVGLMAVPAPAIDGDNSHAFAQMQQLSTQLQQKYANAQELSMGMSDDWQQAVEFGATMIRLGTAIFGARNYAHE